MVTVASRRRDPWKRFMAMVVKSPSGCWLWQGNKGWQGYGVFWDGDRNYRAHRWAWEQAHGPVPTGLQLDHLCRVRACANPDHLEAVTPRENTMRGNTPARRSAEKTHCMHGHEFNSSNTYIHPQRGSRMCRACHRQRVNEHRARRALMKKEMV